MNRRSGLIEKHQVYFDRSNRPSFKDIREQDNEDEIIRQNSMTDTQIEQAI